jgi:hypothetical protein
MLNKNLDFDINSKENLVNYFDNYLNNHGWNNTTQSEQAKLVRKSDMLEFKTRIIEMYLKEFEHNIYMLKKLNKINNFSSKFLILNFPNKLENLTTLKNIKTESDLLLYSINNVNNIINSIFIRM